MTTFHGPTRSATIDRRKLLVTTDDGETAICSTLSQATEYALGYVRPEPSPLPRLLVEALVGSTTWR